MKVDKARRPNIPIFFYGIIYYIPLILYSQVLLQVLVTMKIYVSDRKCWFCLKTTQKCLCCEKASGPIHILAYFVQSTSDLSLVPTLQTPILLYYRLSSLSNLFYSLSWFTCIPFLLSYQQSRLYVTYIHAVNVGGGRGIKVSFLLSL